MTRKLLHIVLAGLIGLCFVPMVTSCGARGASERTHSSDDDEDEESDIIIERADATKDNEEEVVSSSESRKLSATAKCHMQLSSQAGNNYYASNIVDGNPATGWAVDLDEPGVIEFGCLTGPSFIVNGRKLDYIMITNGYAKSSKAFQNNSRARRISIWRENADEFSVVAENDESDLVYEGVLEDTMRPQRLKVRSGFDSSRPIGKLYLVIDDFYHGSKYNDLVISEVEFFGK